MNINSYTSTLLKSFEVLNCFKHDRQEIGIKEIALKIDMPQSSVYRIIRSLEFGGYIFQNGENKKYRLGPKFLSFSSKYDSFEAYRQVAIRNMERLSRETGETINLAILDCDKIAYIHRVDCKHILRPSFSLSSLYPAYKTGLGLVLLSQLNEGGLQWVYTNNAEDIGVSYEEFQAQIAKVRKNGYAFDDQAFCPGLRCVAAPIHGPGGRTIFSMSVSAPLTRMDDSVYDATRRLVTKYARMASSEIREM